MIYLKAIFHLFLNYAYYLLCLIIQIYKEKYERLYVKIALILNYNCPEKDIVILIFIL